MSNKPECRQKTSTRGPASAAIVLLLTGLVIGTAAMAAEPLELIDTLDLERYQGRWYEIARLPNRFQNQCASDVTAHYELLGSGKVQVTNRCRKADGDWMEAQGTARPDASDGREAALEVRFAPRWLSLLPFVWGDYRVIALDQRYTHALVGSRDRKYLWVLARQPDLSEPVIDRLVSEARRQGFDVSGLERTLHSR